MNKKQFLKELEKRLSILEDNERNDIINEYSDTIDEKIKHGQTEEEAIKDFGSFDELVNEILKAYKINPKCDYYEETDFKKGVKEASAGFSSFVKSTSKSMASAFREFSDEMNQKGEEVTLERIFEWILVGVGALVIFAILGIPFSILRGFGHVILGSFLVPFNFLFVVIWNIVLTALYIVICIFIGIFLYRKYVKGNIAEVIKSEIREPKKKKSEVKEESVAKEEVKVEPRHESLNVFSIIFKTFAVVFMIPFVGMNVGIFIALLVAVYLMTKGIFIVGVIILLIGLMILFDYFRMILHRLAFTHKRISIAPIFVSFAFIIIGGLFTVEYAFSLEYSDMLPNDRYYVEKKTYDEQLSNYLLVRGDIDQRQVVVDNTLANDSVRIEVNYYKDVTNFTLNKQDESCQYGRCEVIYIDRTYRDSHFGNINIFNKNIIDDLKNKKIYNYGKLNDINVIIYANDVTAVKIK